MDIGLWTELHLSDLAASARPEPESLMQARSVVQDSPAMLDSLRVYTAVADMEEDGRVPVELWALSLAPTEGGGTLVLAIASSGIVLRSRVWGNETFDEDPNASWGVFWDQFEYDGSRSVIDPADATSYATVEAYRDSLAADTASAASLARLMYEHRLIMYENSHFLQRSSAASGADRVPPLEWIETFRSTYDRMAEIAEELRPVIGDSAAAGYAQVVEDGAEVLALVAESAAAGSGDAVRDQALAFRRRTCGACHGIDNHTAGPGKLKNALFTRLEELGVRRDLYRAGLDVWAAPQDVARSQVMADAVKAVLVVAGSR
jgi:hypothetical protein